MSLHRTKPIATGVPVQKVADHELIADVSALADGKWHMAGTQFGSDPWVYKRTLDTRELRKDIQEGTVVSCTGWLDDSHHTMGWFVRMANRYPGDR